jgi:hypothetical protein
LTFCDKSGSGGWPTDPDFFAIQILFSCFVQIFYQFPCLVESTDLSTGKQHHILAPWTPIAKPEEVVLDALGVSPTTEMTSSSMLLKSISRKACRLGGGLLLCISESLWSRLFVGGRTFGTIGTRSTATACRSRKVSPVS